MAGGELKKGYRRLKADILDLLRRDDFQPSMADKLNAAPNQTVNPLIGLLYHGEAIIRWRSVAALGHVVSRLAATGREPARVVMRRLMWNLNDESGGIGWGSPEAMAEIMAREPGLAQEYAGILVSYLDPRGNFLENEGLQSGVLWGIGRLGRRRAGLVAAAAPHILPFLNARDAALRAMAIWAATALPDEALQVRVRFQDDTSVFTLFQDNRLQTLTIASLVAQADDQHAAGTPPCHSG
jgi:hypothetical protein